MNLPSIQALLLAHKRTANTRVRAAIQQAIREEVGSEHAATRSLDDVVRKEYCEHGKYKAIRLYRDSTPFYVTLIEAKQYVESLAPALQRT